MLIARRTRPRGKQDGAILIVALVFLVAISLLGKTSMRSSRIGLMIAQNEESRIVAVQAAQALADAIVANPASTPVVGPSGYTACTTGETGCDNNDLPVTDPKLAEAVAADFIDARVERVGTEFRPPPRALQSSIDKFGTESFQVTTPSDRVHAGLGRQQIVEGILVLVPKE